MAAITAADELLAWLKLYDYDYCVKPVRAAVIRDMGRMTIDGVELELRKGTEIELPRWAAKELERRGIVEVLEKPLTVKDIARIHFSVISAHTPVELDPLPQYFYNSVREYYKELDQVIREKYSSALLEEKSKAANYIVGIVSKRLSLILQVLRSPSSIAEIESRLAPEEKILLDVMRRIMEKWEEKILGFITE